MIRRMKVRFVLLSMSALFALLLVIVAGMNIVNYTAVCREADELLALMSQNKGDFPEMMKGGPGRIPPNMSRELPHELRYFSVLLDEKGGTIHAETGRIASVDSGDAIAYAQSVMASGREKGFVGRYRFIRMDEDHGVRITFLDHGRKLDSFRSFLVISITMALGGFVLVFFIMAFCAGRIVRPMAESYEKQRQFITNAGHEIKTPLTIIRTNVDLLEMDLPENESLADIRQQTQRLTTLTNDLVTLARMEEERALPMIDFPVSEVVQEAAAPFQALAQAQGKAMTLSVQPMLTMRGNDKAVGQLVSILMDNALKYTPAGGHIALELTRQGRTVTLTARNDTAAPVEQESLRHVFDRFYRAEGSRNSQTGGHGIGLAIARSIVTAHGGRIAAATSPEGEFIITAAFQTQRVTGD